MLQIQKQTDEYNLLVEHYKAAQSRLIRERAHAVIMSMEGEVVPRIAVLLLRKESTVRAWLKAYQAERLASIFPGYKDNINASKLTHEQLTAIKATLQAPPDSVHGLPGSFWSMKKVTITTTKGGGMPPAWKALVLCGYRLALSPVVLAPVAI